MEPKKIKFEVTPVIPINLNDHIFTGIKTEELEYWFNKELREAMGGNIAIHKPK